MKPWRSRGHTYLGEQRTPRAKALRWVHAQCVWGLARRPVLLKDSRHVRKVSKVIGTILGPCGHRLTLTFPLSVRESPWMVLSKEINKNHSGCRRRKRRRTDRKISEQASAHPGKRCWWHGLEWSQRNYGKWSKYVCFRRVEEREVNRLRKKTEAKSQGWVQVAVLVC